MIFSVLSPKDVLRSDVLCALVTVVEINGSSAAIGMQFVGGF